MAPENRDVLKRVVGLINAGRADQLRRLLADLDQTPFGPFPSAEAALHDTVCRLVAQLRPDEIWLFGGRARGDHRPDSEIDLVVVLPDGLDRNAYTLEAVRRPLLGGGVPADILPVARSVFDNDPEALGGLVATAKAEGRQLYRAHRLDKTKAA